MKPGRNDPCPCGSGRKFKHCCLAAEPDPRQLTWRRLRRELDGFPEGLLRFVLSAYGGDVLDEAWEKFTFGGEEPFTPETPHMGVFMAWLANSWSPDPENTGVPDASLHGVRPMEAYLARMGGRLGPLLKGYLESGLAGRFSFYEVEQTRPGEGFTARDLFTGAGHEVQERSASEWVQRGDLFYGMLAQVENLTLLDACGPVALPPQCKIDVVELRDELLADEGALRGEVLSVIEPDLRDLYLELTGHLLDPPMPEMQNTDGEPLVLQKLVFDIDSPQAAFDALKHLDFDTPESELLKEARRDAQGQLREVALCWKKAGNEKHPDWTNTILGHIEIKDRRMLVQVNSESRADLFRGIVQQLLGTAARYRLADVLSADKAIVEARAGGASRHATAGQDELMQSPEVAAHLAQMLERHYEHWVEEAIPALGGKTPLDAIKDSSGREKVEALIRQFERDSRSMMPLSDPAVFRRLRERLGLAVDAKIE